MPVIATWRHKRFEVSKKRIAALENFSTSMKAKTKSNNDNAGSSPLLNRGFEPQPVSFDFTVSDAAGVDVRREWEEWVKLAGSVAPLYIGGLLFGPDNLELIDTSMSDALIDNLGRFRKATISLTFKEYAEEGSAKKSRIQNYVAINRSTAVDVGPGLTEKINKRPFSI